MFPSGNEKIISVAIFAFLLGSIFGIFSSSIITDKTIFLPAIATLAAAYLGAWAAYKLADNKKKREYTDACLQNGNRVLFALYERIKALKLVQKQSINPQRDHPLKMISMRPLLNYSYPESEFNIESLMFILGTKHKQLLLDLQNEKECFNVAFSLIKHRSELHFHHVQPAIEASGIQEGGDYTRQNFVDALGERIYAQLTQATDDLIENVDKTIESSEIIKTRLVKALKDLYPGSTILNFDFQEKDA